MLVDYNRNTEVTWYTEMQMIKKYRTNKKQKYNTLPTLLG